jgi:hypothetical protein
MPPLCHGGVSVRGSPRGVPLDKQVGCTHVSGEGHKVSDNLLLAYGSGGIIPVKRNWAGRSQWEGTRHDADSFEATGKREIRRKENEG